MWLFSRKQVLVTPFMTLFYLKWKLKLNAPMSI